MEKYLEKIERALEKIGEGMTKKYFRTTMAVLLIILIITFIWFMNTLNNL
ncbi:hypothetical protein [uncultured Gemella sp.]|nr:hypothetical protein [uncultured Gemella sp.]